MNPINKRRLPSKLKPRLRRKLKLRLKLKLKLRLSLKRKLRKKPRKKKKQKLNNKLQRPKKKLKLRNPPKSKPTKRKNLKLRKPNILKNLKKWSKKSPLSVFLSTKNISMKQLKSRMKLKNKVLRNHNSWLTPWTFIKSNSLSHKLLTTIMLLNNLNLLVLLKPTCKMTYQTTQLLRTSSNKPTLLLITLLIDTRINGSIQKMTESEIIT